MRKQYFNHWISFFCLLVGSSFLGYTQEDNSVTNPEAWVEQILQSLSEEERIAQLIMIPAHSNKDEAHYQATEVLIQQYNVGGLLFFQGTPENQVALTNRYQQAAKTPLLIAMDAEWGLGMRLKNALSYPRQMTLGALRDDRLIYDMGAEIARQLKLMGVHINFSPVIDVNNNPDNPVIGRRSFGEHKEKVAAKGTAYMQGLQDHGILAVAKHFPGHGDTSKDSHYELPIITHDRERLDALELFPFKKAIEAGLQGIMVAHLHVPAYDPTPDHATTLSQEVVTDLLKQQLGFRGLAFTDALRMKAVSTHYPSGEAALLALQAGNDVLVCPEAVPIAIERIQQALQQGEVDRHVVDEKVKQILRVKHQMHLHQWQPMVPQNLAEQLHTPQAHLLKQQLFEQAVTVVANEADLIPLRDLDQLKIASLSIVNEAGEAKTKEERSEAISDTGPQQAAGSTVFSRMLQKYAPVDSYALARASMTLETLAHTLKDYQVVIVDIHGMHGKRSSQFGLTPEELHFLQALEEETAVIVVPFGSAYSLECFKNFKHVIMPYEDDAVAEKVVPQIIFGALPAMGHLPVSIPGAWQAGWGIRTAALQRLGYTHPEAVGMDSYALQAIDTIAEEAIAAEATPGCQVLVARQGKVVFEKGYGYHTYEKHQPVTPGTLYDIASITKVVGTLQALMYLVGEETLNLKKKMSFYMPELRGTNKGRMKIRKILAHQAGLLPYLHQELKEVILDEDGQLRPQLFSKHPSATYHYQLAEHLYGADWLRDLVWDTCVASALRKSDWLGRYDYQYSCVGTYMMHRLVERLLQQPMDHFLETHFYAPLGVTTTYRPLQKFAVHAIAPAEEDMALRNTLIHGTVHDPMAALYGGVAGNAGLFSNANSLAIILQMNLQDGYYGGKRYLEKGVVTQFAAKHSKNSRRGLGWDKPTGIGTGPTSVYASPDTYGHSGFTGTTAWVDPQYDLVYVFLSNRTYPDADNPKLATTNVRTRIHDVVYEAMQVSDPGEAL
ncbi:MAG: glycoside hydrolase family 3 N-terminal domain-containing protein [Roseivirga sp.]